MQCIEGLWAAETTESVIVESESSSSWIVADLWQGVIKISIWTWRTVIFDVNVIWPVDHRFSEPL